MKELREALSERGHSFNLAIEKTGVSGRKAIKNLSAPINLLSLRKKGVGAKSPDFL